MFQMVLKLSSHFDASQLLVTKSKPVTLTPTLRKATNGRLPITTLPSCLRVCTSPSQSRKKKSEGKCLTPLQKQHKSNCLKSFFSKLLFSIFLAFSTYGTTLSTLSIPKQLLPDTQRVEFFFQLSVTLPELTTTASKIISMPFS